MNGYGVLEQYGQIYEGEFENNAKSGKGVLQYNDGSLYKGDFKNNLPDGEGILMSQLGESFFFSKTFAEFLDFCPG
jgi:hypothetical protein